MPENLLEPITGLSESKLSQATASSSDVLSGKTFYAGDKELKTGTFDLSSATATEEDVLSGKTFYARNNELKTGSMTKINHLKISSSGTSVTVKLSSYLSSSIYSKLTTDNIVIEPSGFSVNWGEDGGGGGHSTSLNKKYTASTGVLTFNLRGNAGIWDLAYGASSATVHVFY